MDEQDFLQRAEATLKALENWLECTVETHDLDIDVEPGPGGILELGFRDGSKIVINRHTAAREIWMATRQFGHHFSPEAGGMWRARRDGAELYETLIQAIEAQSGYCLTPYWPGHAP